MPPITPQDFGSATNTRAKGRIAESAAVRWLERQGYEVVATNFTVRNGEIDVIAIDRADHPAGGGGTLCFIEIKARRSTRCGPAIAAVTTQKQHRIAKVAAAFLNRARWSGPCRFDVLGLDREDSGWKFTLIRDAFALG